MIYNILNYIDNTLSFAIEDGVVTYGIDYDYLENTEMFDCKYDSDLWIDKDGRLYQGGFKYGMRNGTGRSMSTRGSAYEGEWKDDKKHGTGIKIYQNGDSYIGEWKNNKYHGNGVFIRFNLYELSGTFVDGILNGYAGSYWNDENGVRKGQGTMIYIDNSKYVGLWEDNDRCGYGMGKWNNEIRRKLG